MMVTIPHGGLGTVVYNSIEMDVVTIPHGCSEPYKSEGGLCIVLKESPSHTVGSELFVTGLFVSHPNGGLGTNKTT
jgi:hypothetical protein